MSAAPQQTGRNGGAHAADGGGGRTHPARLAGRIVLGLVLGLALVPALLELGALSGAVSAFKYQGF